MSTILCKGLRQCGGAYLSMNILFRLYFLSILPAIVRPRLIAVKIVNLGQLLLTDRFDEMSHHHYRSIYQPVAVIRYQWSMTL